MSPWLAVGQTTELISEIESGGIPPVSTVMGRKGGATVAKELVYTYACGSARRFT
ncbi:hypothetical protein [Methylobacillus sp.]|uniref:hypothetical protein n=1 Tax=Methylobacillus sp. TaxID=56818 RepID=UPI002FE2AA49